MWAVGSAAHELAAGAVEDDRSQDEHHAGDDDQVGEVVDAPMAGVMAAHGGQKHRYLYRQHILVIQGCGIGVKSIEYPHV